MRGRDEVTFVQLIEYQTARPDEMDDLLDQWITQTEGRRTASRELRAQDRQNPTHFVDIVEFSSFEQAMRNNDLPETQRLAERMSALCKGEPRFVNLEVRHDVTL